MLNAVKSVVTSDFSKEIAKTLVLSAAATAGTFAGIAAIGFVIEKYNDWTADKPVLAEHTPPAE